MNINEIVGRLKAGGLDASSTNRSAAVYVTEARSGRAVPGWFGFRIVCDSEATERRVRSILSRWYDIEANGNVWRLRAKNRVPLMAIKRGGVPPTPPTPTDGPMYFEAVQANSTVSLMSMLATAPNLEYSTDGETWQEWQHVTADSVHTFDTMTLTDVGDRVYLRGDNPNGFSNFENEEMSFFSMTGKLAAHGNAQSLVDGDTLTLVAKPMPMFSDFMMTQEQPSDVLVSAPSLPATTLMPFCYAYIFAGCAGLESMPIVPLNIDIVTSIEEYEILQKSFIGMLLMTLFNITEDGGETLAYFPNISFPVRILSENQEPIVLYDSYIFAGGSDSFGLMNTNGFELVNLHLYSDATWSEGSTNINAKCYSFHKQSNENGGVVSWYASPEIGVDIELIDNTVQDYSTITKWQTSADGVNWTDIPDSADRFLSVHIQENGDYYYRVLHS